jgi:hypothetical protein
MDSSAGSADHPSGLTRLTTTEGDSFNNRPAVVDRASLSSKAVPRIVIRATIDKKRRMVSRGYRKRSLTDQANSGKNERMLSIF